MVINSFDGSVEAAQVFDTYKTSYKLEEFVGRDWPDGYIVVAASEDDCASQLSLKAKQWFGNMGSLRIWDLKYRASFAFIG